MLCRRLSLRVQESEGVSEQLSERTHPLFAPISNVWLRMTMFAVQGNVVSVQLNTHPSASRPIVPTSIKAHMHGHPRVLLMISVQVVCASWREHHMWHDCLPQRVRVSHDRTPPPQLSTAYTLQPHEFTTCVCISSWLFVSHCQPAHYYANREERRGKWCGMSVGALRCELTHHPKCFFALTKWRDLATLTIDLTNFK